MVIHGMITFNLYFNSMSLEPQLCFLIFFFCDSGDRVMAIGFHE